MTRFLDTLKFKHFSKNLLILLPFIDLKNIELNLLSLNQYLLTFLTFSLVAQSIYMFNDYMDIAEDKKIKFNIFNYYKRKKIKKNAFFLHTFIYAFLGLTTEYIFGNFYNFSILIIYIILNIFYNFYFKSKFLMSFIVLLIFYNLRLLCGLNITDLFYFDYFFQIIILNLFMLLFLVIKKGYKFKNKKTKKYDFFIKLNLYTLIIFFAVFLANNNLQNFNYQSTSVFFSNLINIILIIISVYYICFNYIKISERNDFKYDIMENIFNFKNIFLLFFVIILYLML